MPILTIFTPTFNREQLLIRLYKSLCLQTSRNFLWLIVDDGSEDNTRELVKKFINEGNIEIIYFYQSNMGKHVAHNKALEICSTELFMCVDSDDTLLDNAVKIIADDFKKFHLSEERYLGCYYRKIDTKRNLMGTIFPKKVLELKIMDLYDMYNFVGDTGIVLKTKYAKLKKFPTFKNEKFVTESVYYRQINDLGIMKIHDTAICCCEYQEDGYSANATKLILKNPYGFAFTYLQNAVYMPNLLKASKNYSQFLSLCILFTIKGSTYIIGNSHVNYPVKILGMIFLPHYYLLYKKLIKKFNLNKVNK